MFNYLTYFKNYNSYVESINGFVAQIFNFYNGKINMCNKAKLLIDWAMLPSKSVLGTSTNPNIVTIYPRVVERYTHDAFDYHFCLLETVIHELFHIDQIIDYRRMVNDRVYMKSIEDAVETQTVLYLANHLTELAQFGFYVQREYIDHRMKYCTYAPYHRRKYLDHIFIIFTEMLPNAMSKEDSKKFYNNFEQCFKYPDTSFVFNINGISLVVKGKDYTIDIDSFNKRIFDIFFKYNYRMAHVEYTIAEDCSIIIDIRVDGSNMMCKLKEESK